MTKNYLNTIVVGVPVYLKCTNLIISNGSFNLYRSIY